MTATEVPKLDSQRLVNKTVCIPLCELARTAELQQGKGFMGRNLLQPCTAREEHVNPSLTQNCLGEGGSEHPGGEPRVPLGKSGVVFKSHCRE